MLRSAGLAYRDLEDQGYLLVLTKIEVRYRSPAHYDDLLTLRTTVEKTTAVRIDHRYELLRDGTLLAEGRTTLACPPPMFLGGGAAGFPNGIRLKRAWRPSSAPSGCRP